MLRNVALYGVVSLGALAFGRDPGCGGTDSPSSGLNAPCTRSKDCTNALVCTEGVCTESDSGVIPPDGGRDAAPAEDAGNDGG